MKIKVKAHHISQGVPKSHCQCPVALAIKDAGLMNPSVAQGRMLVTNELGMNMYYTPPPEVDVFIHAFDHGLPVSPFEFELPC